MIKLFFTDIDGCLTNGEINYLGAQADALKGFHVLDGAAILRAQKMGIAVAIISGRSSEALAQRAKDLRVEHLIMGCKNKLAAAQELAAKLGVNLATEAAMLGDDYIDLELLKACAYAFVPADAKRLFGQRLSRASGRGCFDEALEILCSQER